MTNFGRNATLWIATVWLLAGCATAGFDFHGNEDAREIARAYGIENFSRISTLKYTFNADINGKRVERSWIWEPGEDRVTFTGKNAEGAPLEAGYVRSEPGFDAKVDQWFINDQYWLLFPFHLEWDHGLTVASDGIHSMPIFSGRARRLIVTYPAEVGYTPGDVYELYYDDAYRIKQWVYRKGGSETPTRTTTWEDHAELGPIVVSMSHSSGDGAFRLWFTDVAVRMAGSDDWQPARVMGK